jgi:hypothetical protein
MSVKRMITCAFALACLSGTSVDAKPKKKPPAADSVKKNEDVPPPPGYKGTNEGATGRKNATEDAARSAESPATWDRRFGSY